MTAVAEPGVAERAAAMPAAEVVAPPKKSSKKLVIILGIAAVLGLAGAGWYVTHKGLESTDDAQVDSDVVAVPARMGGVVTKLYFTDNQKVKAGDLLAEIDPAPSNARLAQAEAELLSAKSSAAAAEAEADLAGVNARGQKSVAQASLQGASVGVTATSQQIDEAIAAVAASKSESDRTRTDLERTKNLFASGSVSKAALDNSQSAFDSADARLKEAQAHVSSLKATTQEARARVTEASARLTQASAVDQQIAEARAKAEVAKARVLTAQAARDLAALDVGYQKIYAPHDGEASKRTINVGQMVAAGQTIVMIVPTDEVWITGNFKETQLAKMRVGQPAEMTIDAFGGMALKGKVESFSGATGARFSLLPPDNATGNYTKVVQRVPVRVHIEGASGVALRPGMSVELTIDTRKLVMATAAMVGAPEGVQENWRKWAILFTASLGALLEVIDTSIVNVALTDIQSTVGATLSEVGWVVTSYAIANVIILPLTAWLGDRFGKKRYFIFSLIAFTASSVLCGLSTNLTLLIIARILQGLGGGGLLAKAQSILFETFPPKEQAMAQAVFGICVIAGPAIGPTLGGYLTTNLDWRWIFFINVPVGIAATFASIAFLVNDKPKDANKPVDWTGIALLTVAVGSFQTVLEEGQSDDWFESSFIVAFAVAAVLGTVLFLYRELTYEFPVVNLRVLKHRSLAAGSLLSLVIGLALYGALFAVPIFSQTILGMTAEQTGWLLMPGALASAFMMPVVGKLDIDARVRIVIGGLILMVAMGMLTNLTPFWGADNLFWPLIIRGGGTVFMYLPLTLATLGPIPKKDVAAATGLYSLTRQLGGSIGIAILTTMLDQRNAFHRNVLIEKIGASDPMTLDRLHQYAGIFLARGMDAVSAMQQARVLMDVAVSKQAAVLSYADSFWLVGAVLVCSLPLVVFLGSGKGVKPPADAH